MVKRSYSEGTCTNPPPIPLNIRSRQAKGLRTNREPVARQLRARLDATLTRAALKLCSKCDVVGETRGIPTPRDKVVIYDEREGSVPIKQRAKADSYVISHPTDRSGPPIARANGKLASPDLVIINEWGGSLHGS